MFVYHVNGTSIIFWGSSRTHCTQQAELGEVDDKGDKIVKETDGPKPHKGGGGKKSGGGWFNRSKELLPLIINGNHQKVWELAVKLCKEHDMHPCVIRTFVQFVTNP